VGALLTALGAFAVFLVLYVSLNRRAGRRPFPTEQRGWLLAILACAALAALIGIFTR
jgi:hypothetical membrane protein